MTENQNSDIILEAIALARKIALEGGVVSEDTLYQLGEPLTTSQQ